MRRERAATDKRVVYAHLTEEGLRLLERAVPLHVAGVRRHFLDHVAAPQLAVLADVFGPLQRWQIAQAAGARDEPESPDAEAALPAPFLGETIV